MDRRSFSLTASAMTGTTMSNANTTGGTAVLALVHHGWGIFAATGLGSIAKTRPRRRTSSTGCANKSQVTRGPRTRSLVEAKNTPLLDFSSTRRAWRSPYRRIQIFRNTSGVVFRGDLGYIQVVPPLCVLLPACGVKFS